MKSNHFCGVLDVIVINLYRDLTDAPCELELQKALLSGVQKNTDIIPSILMSLSVTKFFARFNNKYK